MTTDLEHRLARLRGRLRAESLGARGVEHAARNPRCVRLKALTIAGVKPLTAAREVFGDDPGEGQSPFTLSIGQRFERHMTENGAERLVALYAEAGLLEPRMTRVVDLAAELPLPANPGPAAMRDPERNRRWRKEARTVLDRRRGRTLELFRRKLDGDPAAPNLILKARFPVAIGDLRHEVEADALRARDADAFYRPVEIKSYPDRDGKTDPADVRSACRQAAVYVVGSGQQVARLGHTPAAVRAAADLVLRRPGGLAGSLRTMAIAGEVETVERFLAQIPRSLGDLERMLAGASLDDPAVLEAIPAHYVSGCREHCALAPRCRREARACGDPAVLGDQARQALVGAGDVDRAHALMRGRPPVDAVEEAVARRLVAAFEFLRSNRHA